MKYMRIAVLAILALMLLSPVGALAVSAQVTGTSARIYRSSSTSSASAALESGVSVSVKSVSGQWAKVSYKGVTGYVPSKYLTTSSSADTAKSSRYRAYINKKTYVYKTPSASSAKKSVAVNTEIYVVGTSGSYYKVQKNGSSACGYVLKSCVSGQKVAQSSASWKSRVVMMDWFSGGDSAFPSGSYGYIYDIDTGIYLRIKRMGGHNHADVEPATRSDTAKLKKIAGGTFSWNSHAVILKTGSRFIACAINTMPHGDQTIKNNGYDGQFCLHMVGSITHGTESVNSNHQASIQRAYDWAH